MASCPKCNKGTLKKGEKMVYCSEYKPSKVGNDWKNEGTCEFRILFDQKKVFGKALESNDIKSLLDGKTLQNGQKKMVLDLNSSYFVTITKDEDQDF